MKRTFTHIDSFNDKVVIRSDAFAPDVIRIECYHEDTVIVVELDEEAFERLREAL